ncbi:MAG: hypothetical protein ACT4OS_07255 [Acidimicrobiales bacterium]
MSNHEVPGSFGDQTGRAETEDPVLARRAQMDRLAQRGKRWGYGLYVVAVVSFVVAAVSGLPQVLTTLVIASLLAGSALLIPAIIVGYGVRGAERDEAIGRAPGRGVMRGRPAVQPGRPARRSGPVTRGGRQ